MVLTPIVGIIFKRFTQSKASVSLENINIAEGLTGNVLMIGFRAIWAGNQSIIVGKRSRQSPLLIIIPT